MRAVKVGVSWIWIKARSLIEVEPTLKVRALVFLLVCCVMAGMWLAVSVIDWQLTHGAGSTAIAVGLLAFLALEFPYWHWHIRYSLKHTGRDMRVGYAALVSNAFLAFSATAAVLAGIDWLLWAGVGAAFLSIVGPLSFLSIRLPSDGS